MRAITIALGLSVIAASAAAVAGDTPRGEATITCSNLTSGATWQVRIDYDHRTADSNPARISDAQISWHDPTDGGNYTLDRASGELTVVVASSTGGYFLHHRCKLQN